MAVVLDDKGARRAYSIFARACINPAGRSVDESGRSAGPAHVDIEEPLRL
jgi:hypothetical protein